MKNKNSILTLKSILSITLMLCIAISLQSCAKKIKFSTSSVVPAAEGSVKISEDKNNNYKIDINIMRLAEPNRLTPPKAMYIVWIETDRSGIQNIGQLKTSSHALSKTLKSSLKTVSAFSPTRIFITGEDNAAIQYPSGETVLTTGNF